MERAKLILGDGLVYTLSMPTFWNLVKSPRLNVVGLSKKGTKRKITPEYFTKLEDYVFFELEEE